ncbi:outer membrane beta-barrel protein [Winogradskyella sp. A3E31]|uniref:outer membrane beta-barrel protein n=1 Tax=Winogradskyella sp. A3E31 TaxID=3349637 RepID=UPI00398B47D7
MAKSNKYLLKSLIVFLFCHSFAIAQVDFVEGYIIKNGNKEKVFIRDLDWSNNPESFSYKVTLDNNNLIQGNTNNIDEFGIGKIFRYVTATVSIDQSSSQVSRMTNYPEPNFISKTVFLKQIVEGSANLYSYQNNKFVRFFYQVDGNSIEPLVYKKYKLNQSQISENLEYKLKLANNLKCNSLNTADFRSLKYDNQSLVNLFIKYNTCAGADTFTYNRIDKSGGYFNFGIKAGVFTLGLDVKEEGEGFAEDLRSADMGTQTSIRIAVEVEYILPFNKNKWSIFMEPGYQSFSSEEDIEVNSQNENFNQRLIVDYNYVDVPFGVRHYMFLNDKNKLFVSMALAFTFDLSNSKFDYEGNLGVRDSNINSSANLVFGIGYNFNEKISIEARVNTARNITRDEAFLNSNFSSSGIVLAYYFL